MTKTSFILIFFSFSLTIFSTGSFAANTTLDQFYQRTQSMQADFEQTVRNSQGKTIEQSQGQLIFSRPDKFILEYNLPAEQKYISDGKNIWIYDVELEQVSIKSLDEGVGDSPALLLSSNTNVYKHYQVNDVQLTQSNDYHWVQLKARDAEMTFDRVLLAFNDNTLMQMRMYDSFGQITDLKFSQVQVNKPFSNRQFHFVPPEGVDVIGSANAR